ncbi:50S ribosomal protein L25/general stress protein Ctc [Phaeocystidibacter marisrubri]|uniref:Large ribosomal subunit protein bL25 n=1 Tax=Phaeocystidibacter marisrubri TaxID=1577780 RepID=A0A6L3ZGT6_9FLAO|nr:50S ribosomal protein L25/general stress protein Ctc [Phaeocystidibacter marisrubri]KAB2816169.1 50S ribosomal protein L25/general stress protein Ctc [Phaeocystidibacter marisrubri]GGH67670.1 50S ribosomal protein L25 [Phaeocystidibacter marisrubri]
MNSIAIKGTVRTDLGTKYAKNLRKEGQVPCVVYGGEETIHFSAPILAFRDLVYTSMVHKAEIELDGKKVEAVVQDMQFDPLTDELVHMDLVELVEGKEVTVQAPVRLNGNARGVRNGGKLKHFLRYLKVKALPQDIPASIELDITDLRIGQAIRVGAVKTDKYAVLNAESAVIVTIKTARNAVEDTDEEEGDDAAEGAEAPAAEATAE